jgi:hypothetical protein
MTQAELEKRMKTTIPETPDLRAEVEERLAGKPKQDDKSKREFTFQFRHEAPNGKIWEGTFTNHVLSLRERQMVGIMRARLGGGMPVESLDPLTAEINLMLAHLEYSLTDKPDWAKDLSKVEDLGMVQALYAEVATHEATFLGWGKVTAGSESKSG